MENLLSTNICISDSLKNRYPFDEGNNAVTFTLQTHSSVQIMIYFGGAGQSASHASYASVAFKSKHPLTCSFQ